MFNLEAFIPKLCQLAQEVGEDERAQSLRSAGLQALSSMVLHSSCCYCTFKHMVIITLCLVTVETKKIKQDFEFYSLNKFIWRWVGENFNERRFKILNFYLFSIPSMSRQTKAVILNLWHFCIINDPWIQIIFVCKIFLM
jgi:hypothetical protein